MVPPDQRDGGSRARVGREPAQGFRHRRNTEEVLPPRRVLVEEEDEVAAVVDCVELHAPAVREFLQQAQPLLIGDVAWRGEHYDAARTASLNMALDALPQIAGELLRCSRHEDEVTVGVRPGDPVHARIPLLRGAAQVRVVLLAQQIDRASLEERRVNALPDGLLDGLEERVRHSARLPARRLPRRSRGPAPPRRSAGTLRRRGSGSRWRRSRPCARS